MSVEIIIPIAAVVVVLLIFAWSVKVIKASIKTLLTIAGILILLQIAFGINSEQIIQAIVEIFNGLKQLVLGI